MNRRVVVYAFENRFLFINNRLHPVFIPSSPTPPRTPPRRTSSFGDRSPSSVISSSFGTPRSTRKQVAGPEEFLELTIRPEDLLFAESLKGKKVYGDDEGNIFSTARDRFSTARDMATAREPPPVKLLNTKEVFSLARHGKVGELERALVDFPIDSRDENGNTLFIVACQNGNRKIAQILIDKGANMNSQNKSGNTGLHFLFAFGYKELAEFFITIGADPNIQNSNSLTCRQGLKKAEISQK